MYRDPRYSIEHRRVKRTCHERNIVLVPWLTLLLAIRSFFKKLIWSQFYDPLIELVRNESSEYLYFLNLISRLWLHEQLNMHYNLSAESFSMLLFLGTPHSSTSAKKSLLSSRSSEASVSVSMSASTSALVVCVLTLQQRVRTIWKIRKVIPLLFQ